MMKKYKHLLSIFVVLFFSFVAGFALLRPGLPPTHDGEYHVIRFYEFDKTLRAGDWYPRWASDLNNGYGVPLFNYVYPLPNYFASFLHLFGISFIDAFKLNMFVATIIGGIFFYLWSRQYWGDIGGVISAVFYIFSPYKFVDIYIRGSVGEVWALAFFPAFLWAVTNVVKEKNKKFMILSGLFLALIIFSHNILALMFFPFVLSYILFLILVSKEKLYAVRHTLFAIFLGLGLSAIFWIPALFEQQFVTGLQIYDVEKNFPEFYQLLIPSWGSGFSQGSLEGQTSFQIGMANLIAVLVSIVFLLFSYKKNKNKEAAFVTVFFLVWFLFVFFLFLKESLFIWKHVPFMNFFQFPWRFLSLEILICAFLAGNIVKFSENKIILAVIIFLPFVLGIGYAEPAFYHDRKDNYYITRSNFIDGTNSPGDLFNTVWFNKKLKKSKAKIVTENGSISSMYINKTTYRFDLDTESTTRITVNTAYFAGWKGSIDKKEIDIIPDKNGLIAFFVPKGKHNIEIQLKDTFVRTISETISSLSIFLLALYVLLYFHGIILQHGKK